MAISRKHRSVTWLQHPEAEQWMSQNKSLPDSLVHRREQKDTDGDLGEWGGIHMRLQWSDKGPKKHGPKFQVARPPLSIGPMALQSMIYYDYETLNCSRNYS